MGAHVDRRRLSPRVLELGAGAAVTLSSIQPAAPVPEPAALAAALPPTRRRHCRRFHCRQCSSASRPPTWLHSRPRQWARCCSVTWQTRRCSAGPSLAPLGWVGVACCGWSVERGGGWRLSRSHPVHPHAPHKRFHFRVPVCLLSQQVGSWTTTRNGSKSRRPSPPNQQSSLPPCLSPALRAFAARLAS